jgi:hypothetical protein
VDDAGAGRKSHRQYAKNWEDPVTVNAMRK